MKRIATFRLAAATLALAAPAGADTLSKVPAQLDPAKAYVLIEYRLQKNTMGGFRKNLPLSEGLAFARWDAAAEDIRGLGRAAENPLPPKVAVEEPFRGKTIGKSETSRMVLLEMEPDIWVIRGLGGTSFSLGSYTFELAPGMVTDLGVVTYGPDFAEDQRAITGGDLMKSALLGGLFGGLPEAPPFYAEFRARAAGDMPVPAGIPADKVQPVQFTPGAKFGNYGGGLVNRIEGVNRRLKAETSAAATP